MTGMLWASAASVSASPSAVGSQALPATGIAVVVRTALVSVAARPKRSMRLWAVVWSGW